MGGKGEERGFGKSLAVDGRKTEFGKGNDGAKLIWQEHNLMELTDSKHYDNSRLGSTAKMSCDAENAGLPRGSENSMRPELIRSARCRRIYAGASPAVSLNPPSPEHHPTSSLEQQLPRAPS